VAVLLLVLAAFAFLFDVRRGGREVAEEAPEFDAFAGGYPVPPLPGQELIVTRRAKATVPGTAVSSAVDVGADPPSEGEEQPHE
jgi:NADH-quinone oxidoreductase subunit H